MNNIILSGLLAISLISSTGCIFNDGQGSYKDYVKPAVSLSVLTALDNAVDEEDRVKTALLIYHSGTIVESLATGDVPDKDAVKSALEAYLPEGVMWAEFIASLDDIYKTAYNRTSDKTQDVLEVVAALAAGLSDGAGKYLREHSVEIPGVVD